MGNYIVRFLLFNESLFSLNHCEILDNSIFITSNNNVKLGCLKKKIPVVCKHNEISHMRGFNDVINVYYK